MMEAPTATATTASAAEGVQNNEMPLAFVRKELITSRAPECRPTVPQHVPPDVAARLLQPVHSSNFTLASNPSKHCHFEQLDKREKQMDYLMNHHWTMSFVPEMEQQQRLLSSPESSMEIMGSQQNCVASAKTLRQSLRSSAAVGGSELEKCAASATIECDIAAGDGGSATAPTLDDWELIRLSVRELNQKLAGQDRAKVAEMKQKRRTLKNRGYALNCRARRVRNQQQLEAENTNLRELVEKQASLLAEYERKLMMERTAAGREKDGGGGGEKESTQRELDANQHRVKVTSDKTPTKTGQQQQKQGKQHVAEQPPQLAMCNTTFEQFTQQQQQQYQFYPVLYPPQPQPQQQQQFDLSAYYPTTTTTFGGAPDRVNNNNSNAQPQQNWSHFQ